MKKLLKKSLKKLTGMHSKITGTPSPDLRGHINPDLRGDVSGLSGDISYLSGNISGLSGDISGLSGDVSGLRGNCTNFEGDIDECGLTDEEREKGVDINDLTE